MSSAPVVKNSILTKFRLKKHISAWQMDPVHVIWTKMGKYMLLNPRNKPTEKFLTYRKIQDGGHGRHYHKLRNQL